MQVDRETIIRWGQLLLLLPSTGLVAMALGAGTAGVLGGLAGLSGLFDSGVAVNSQPPGMWQAYLAYILVCVGLLIIPALGFALLVLLIIKGADWMAARRLLAVLTIVIGAAACFVAAWMASATAASESNRFSTPIPLSFVATAALVLPVAIGVFNVTLLVAAMARRRRSRRVGTGTAAW